VNFWYSYDPEDGYTRHETADEAKEAAEASLDYERERSPDGWHENTTDIEWGLLVPYGEARQCNVVDTPEGEFDYTCDYQLVSARPGDPLEEAHRRLERAERERDELRAEVARLRGQSPLLDADPRPLTPEAFIASCQRCRPTKHLHGWHARELGAMVEALARERDEARAALEAK
jgi:hypothetical protein